MFQLKQRSRSEMGGFFMKIVCVNVTTSLYSPYQNQKHMDVTFKMSDKLIRELLSVVFLRGVKAYMAYNGNATQIVDEVVQHYIDLYFTTHQTAIQEDTELKDWVKERIFKLRKSINKAAERDSIDHILNAEQQKDVDMLTKILHAL